MHAFTSDGTRHMEYARTQGSFDDLPLDRILTALDQPTARGAPGAGVADHAFVAPVDTGEASQHAPVDPSGSIRLSTRLNDAPAHVGSGSVSCRSIA